MEGGVRVRGEPARTYIHHDVQPFSVTCASSSFSLPHACDGAQNTSSQFRRSAIGLYTAAA